MPGSDRRVDDKRKSAPLRASYFEIVRTWIARAGRIHPPGGLLIDHPIHGGLLFAGDSAPARDVQFHRVDQFMSWSDYNRAAAPEGEVRVNKRVRSLAM